MQWWMRPRPSRACAIANPRLRPRLGSLSYLDLVELDPGVPAVRPVGVAEDVKAAFGRDAVSRGARIIEWHPIYWSVHLPVPPCLTQPARRRPSAGPIRDVRRYALAQGWSTLVADGD